MAILIEHIWPLDEAPIGSIFLQFINATMIAFTVVEDILANSNSVDPYQNKRSTVQVFCQLQEAEKYAKSWETLFLCIQLI